MTVRIQKPAVNIREKLAELERPIGINGQALLATDTPQQAFDLLGARNKNIIHNGAMEIFQRVTNPVTSLTTETFALCDRWSFGLSSTGTWTASQEGNNPAPGFKSSYKVTLTSASFNTTSAYCFLAQGIEGFNLSDLGYGTSFAKNLTLSFWVKSNYPGTYIIEFEHVSSTNRSISKSYTINQSDVWEYKTITIPGNTNLEFIRDNARRLRVFFWVAAGTSFTSGTLNTTWNTQTNTTRVAGISNGIATNVNGYFEFTGVQLEAGKVATPFEYRSYGQELALCQRYYYKINSATNSAPYQRYALVNCETTTDAEAFFAHPVTMRANPTLGSSVVAGFHIFTANATRQLTAMAIDQSSTMTTGVALSVDSGLTAAGVGLLNSNNNNTSFIEFIAEL